MLHDRTAEAFLADLSRLAHCNVTTVPFQLDAPPTPVHPAPNLDAVRNVLGSQGPAVPVAQVPRHDVSVLTPIISARWRDHVRVEGEVRTLRVLSQHDSPVLEVVITDGTGEISIVFLGRRKIAGIEVGSRLSARAVIGVFHGHLAMLNPHYELGVRSP